MKKLIVSGCAVLASVAALATTTVESANTFGVLKVADNTQKQIIVGIPWEAVGGGSINVTNLVLASGLQVGDALLWYDADYNDYKGWVVDTQDTTKYWKATTTIKVDGKDVTITAAAPKTLSRGNAILIQRSTPAKSTIYLSGQYNSAAATALTIPGPADGTADYFQVWTPIASPKAEEWDLNDENTAIWANVGATDKIIIGPGEEFVRYDSNSDETKDKWAKVGSTEVDYRESKSTVTTYSVEQAKIPVGRGGWYIREGKGNATLTWK